MADFTNLNAVKVSENITTEYRVSQISLEGETPILIVAPATNANRPYMNATLKASAKITQQIRGGRLDSRLLDANRESDRELYTKFVVKGWSNVRESNGQEVDFSLSNCRDFMTALPDWIFDDLRTFCGHSPNFIETLDVETTAKNS